MLSECLQRLENAQPDLPRALGDKLENLRSRTWVFLEVEHVGPVIDALEREAVKLAGKELTFADFRAWHIIIGPEYVDVVEQVLDSVEETVRAHVRDRVTQSVSSSRSSTEVPQVDEQSPPRQPIIPVINLDDNGNDHRESLLTREELDECMRKFRRSKTVIAVKLPVSSAGKRTWPLCSREAEERALKRARGEDTQSQPLTQSLSGYSEYQYIQTPEKWTPEKRKVAASPGCDESPDVIPEYD